MKPFLLLYFLLLAGAVPAQIVRADEEEPGNIKSYRTFRVEKGDVVTVLPPEVTIREDTLLDLISDALSDQLASRGYVRSADSASAEMVVSFVAEVIQRIDTEDLGPLGQRPATTPADLNQGQVWSRETMQGSVQVQVSTARGQKNLWRSRTDVNFGTDDVNAILAGAAVRCLRKVPKRKK